MFLKLPEVIQQLILAFASRGRPEIKLPHILNILGSTANDFNANGISFTMYDTG